VNQVGDSKHNYYGAIGDFASLMQFFKQALGMLLKWLNRRSQRCGYNWRGFRELIERFRIERPWIVGRPKTRRAASTA
jgi:RNA-directed DNA polymerase